jgi:hypothetical protein
LTTIDAPDIEPPARQPRGQPHGAGRFWDGHHDGITAMREPGTPWHIPTNCWQAAAIRDRCAHV